MRINASPNTGLTKVRNYLTELNVPEGVKTIANHVIENPKSSALAAVTSALLLYQTGTNLINQYHTEQEMWKHVNALYQGLDEPNHITLNMTKPWLSMGKFVPNEAVVAYQLHQSLDRIAKKCPNMTFDIRRNINGATVTKKVPVEVVRAAIPATLNNLGERPSISIGPVVGAGLEKCFASFSTPDSSKRKLENIPSWKKKLV